MISLNTDVLKKEICIYFEGTLNILSQNSTI